MWKEIKIDPDRLVFFGCMFGGIVLAVVNYGVLRIEERQIPSRDKTVMTCQPQVLAEGAI